jgi:plastocyanin
MGGHSERWRAATNSFLGAAILSSVLLAGCGTAADSPPPTCDPHGTALTINAPGISFDKKCLAAPAGQAFTVAFDNQQSGTAHNFLISVAFAPGSKVLFQGATVTGPTSTTYDVPGLSPGTYSFECSIHPGPMHGTFIVAAPASSSTTATHSPGD